jgi:hypothetical protein
MDRPQDSRTPIIEGDNCVFHDGNGFGQNLFPGWRSSFWTAQRSLGEIGGRGWRKI